MTRKYNLIKLCKKTELGCWERGLDRTGCAEHMSQGPGPAGMQALGGPLLGSVLSSLPLAQASGHAGEVLGRGPWPEHHAVWKAQVSEDLLANPSQPGGPGGAGGGGVRAEQGSQQPQTARGQNQF